MKNHPTGFFGTLSGSFKFLFKHIWSYVKVTIILALPPIIIGAIATYFINFAPEASAQGGSFFETGEPTAVMEATTGELPEIDFSEVDFSNIPAMENTNFMEGVEKYDPNEGQIELNGALLWGSIIGFLVLTLYQIFAALAVLRLTSKLYNEESWTTEELVKWAASKTWSYLGLVLRIFGYTYGWLIFAALIGFAVINILVMTGGFPASAISATNFALGIAGIIGFVMVIIRGPRVVFAQFAFADSAKNSKEALTKSLKASEGNWLKIVGYALGSAFIIGSILGLITMVIEPMIDAEGAAGWFALSIHLILQALFTYYFFVFYMSFYKQLEK